MRHHSYKYEYRQGVPSATPGRDTDRPKRSPAPTAVANLARMHRINGRSPFGPQQQGWYLSGINFFRFVAAMRHDSYKNEYPQSLPSATTGRGINRPRRIRERGKRKNQRGIAEEEARLSLAEVALTGGVGSTSGVGG